MMNNRMGSWFAIAGCAVVICAVAPPRASAGTWCGGRGRSWEAQVSTTIAVDRYGAADFWKACKSHDECYWRPGSDRGTCDDRFRGQLHEACNAGYPGFFQATTRNACKVAAESYAAAVRTFGHDSYAAGQAEAHDVLNLIRSRGVGEAPLMRQRIGELCASSTERSGRCRTTEVADRFSRFSAADFQKFGNNGTTSCNSFCGAVDGYRVVWGSEFGSCSYAHNLHTGEVISCDVTPGHLPTGQLVCGCNRNAGVKHGNNGAASCETFCSDPRWGGWSGTCVAAYDTRNQASLSCSAIPGYRSGPELTCTCR